MTERPNILFLIGEDTGYHLGCDGDECARTPNFDRLVEEGTLYRKAYSTAPVCAPSRSSFASGRYPWSLGTHNMRSYLCEPPKTVMHSFREAGYYVSWPTKRDFNFEPDSSYRSDESTWMERVAEGELPEPFFAGHNFGVTHESGMWVKPLGGKEWPGAVAEREEFFGQHPEWEHCDPAAVTVPPYLPDTPEVRADIARFYDTLFIQDYQLGCLMEDLRNSPYAENTIIVYTVDHGRGLYREKRWPYPSGVHVPVIVWGPGIEAGKRSERLVSGVDIAPTLLSLAGIEIPEAYEGRAFLGEQEAEPRKYAFSGRDRMDEVFDRVRTATDGEYFYIANDFPNLPYAARLSYMERQLTTQVLRKQHEEGTLAPVPAQWMGEGKPAEELYKLSDDPWCVHNLAGNAQYAAIQNELASALARHREEVGDKGMVSERELEASGLLNSGNLDDYDTRRKPLPEGQQIGARIAPLTVEDVAWEPLGTSGK